MNNDTNTPAITIITKTMAEDTLTDLSSQATEIRLLLEAVEDFMDHEQNAGNDGKIRTQQRLEGVGRLTALLNDSIDRLHGEWMPFFEECDRIGFCIPSNVKTAENSESNANPRKIQPESNTNPAIAA